MFVALATGIASLACQGCVSGESHQAGASAAVPVERSLGMSLAMPGHLGNGPMNLPSEESAYAVASALPEASVVSRLTSEDAPVSVVATSGPRATQSFGLTSSTAIPGPSVANANLGWSSSPALARVAAELSTRRYGQPQEVSRDMSFDLAISAPSERTGLGFDVGVAPRFAMRDIGDVSSQRFGGELRFGRGLDVLGKGGQPDGWYFFVGADGEALVWDTDSTPSFSDILNVQVTDQVTVGDLQAGVSIQKGGGELSFAYIRREMKFDDRNGSLRDTEDFAGISFTMRR